MTRRPTLGPQPLHLPRLTATSFRTLATPMTHRRMFCSAAVVGEKIIVIGEGSPPSLFLSSNPLSGPHLLSSSSPLQEESMRGPLSTVASAMTL
jgi:hypothetical protein